MGNSQIDFTEQGAQHVQRQITGIFSDVSVRVCRPRELAHRVARQMDHQEIVRRTDGTVSPSRGQTDVFGRDIGGRRAMTSVKAIQDRMSRSKRHVA